MEADFTVINGRTWVRVEDSKAGAKVFSKGGEVTRNLWILVMERVRGTWMDVMPLKRARPL